MPRRDAAARLTVDAVCPNLSMMDIERKVAYWTDIADYDLGTARAMLSSGRFLYAAFMSQQAFEKTLKAAFIARGRGGEPPRTHNLSFLLDQLGLDDVPERVASLASRLSAYYIEARYPNYKEKLSALVGEAEARSIVRDTEEALSWVRLMLN